MTRKLVFKFKLKYPKPESLLTKTQRILRELVEIADKTGPLDKKKWR
ncbi:hypothetical protein [Lentilactobacillus hilgardii]|nr:hypothetical protein [Lentilactobacillus hilgardii]